MIKRKETFIYALIIAVLNMPLLFGQVPKSMIFLSEKVLTGELWRIFTHPFAHISWYHLLLDGLAFFLLYTQLAEVRPLRRTLYVVGSGAMSLLAVVIVMPSLGSVGYCGLSGIAHGLMAVCSLEMINTSSGDRSTKLTGIVCMLILTGKCIIEAVTGKMVFAFVHSDLIGSPIAVSHVGGLVGAILTYYAIRLAGWRRSTAGAGACADITPNTKIQRKETKMKILLIAPASGKWRRIGQRKLFNGKVFRFSMLSLLTVAKLSPEDAEITIVDEQFEEIPKDEGFDLVGITAMSAAAPRAYEIAEHFRSKGVPVVLGGFHASLNPEDASGHVDTIVVGSAFGAWEKIIEDLRTGTLEKVYHGDSNAKVPKELPRHLIDHNKYITPNATYATMGCKNRCKFCSISAFYDATHHCRSIDDVVGEVASFKKRFFIFVDDNLTQNRDFAVELFKKLAGLKKKWVTQASIEIADDEELLGLMSKAGCVGVFVGLETFNRKTLCVQDKSFNTPSYYREAVRKIHSYGMFVESGVIFGFDNDDVNVFNSTLNMLESIGIDAILVSILTPLPGTGLYKEMKDRISDRNLEHYDYRHVVFEPEKMSAYELQGGADWVIRKFYSPWRIFRRFLRWMTMPGGWKNFVYLLIPNLAYYGRVKSFGIKGYDPASGVPEKAEPVRVTGSGNLVRA